MTDITITSAFAALLTEEIAELKRRADWQPIETAPKDGTVVDLWGTDKTDKECEGLMMDPRLYVRRFTDCQFWSPRALSQPSGLLMPLPLAWYQAKADRYIRIWPTHWMPVQGKPT